MIRYLLFFALIFGFRSPLLAQQVLKTNDFKHYVEGFNQGDEEYYHNFIGNNESWAFMSANIPLLDCPDKDIERTYYFRWWTYRKHIKKTPEGYVITEFLPDVPWSGKYNTISCPAALHFYEGRWLRDHAYLNDYAQFWFKGGGNPRLYSFWAADAIYKQYLVSGDPANAGQLLPDLISNYSSWEKEKLDANGLFWQVDDRDGMEVSVCGSGYRPTINSYMYGDAVAISKIAGKRGQSAVSNIYRQKAEQLKSKVQGELWDNSANFFKVKSKQPGSVLCDARELLGYTPWYFNMPDAGYSRAWQYLIDSNYFKAPYGPASVARNHPGFKLSYEGHECQWNGPSWPYSTSITLTAMANLLNNYSQRVVGRNDYYELLKTYAVSQQLKTEDGKLVPWIDENLNPLTGDWISRTRLKTWANGTWAKDKGGVERGKDYNHSTFCDLIISGLIGLRPSEGKQLVINPLLPEGKWDYFCLDKISYHGKEITVLYDRFGTRYKKGKGFMVWVNGEKQASSSVLKKVVVNL
ncbi:MAG TPA: glycosyl hydrolase family 65 protein [Pedobacter sp.]|uniref:MGH1-like glycoside hydrolase domain-containing protein n=1 Tax=Pedobacter sp. TaxID=1411316 RepID=UPI002BFED072|nr:glycosyl hydrolase family 65 protein [Pedobacter sp.]HMI03200.1 glycosyl hydrolase family 65 protein [Pedobacter sp.]